MFGIDMLQYWLNLFKHDSTLFKHGDVDLVINGDNADKQLPTDGKNYLGVMLRFAVTLSTAGGGSSGTGPQPTSAICTKAKMKGSNYSVGYSNIRSLNFMQQIFTDTDRYEDDTATAPGAGATSIVYATVIVPGCFVAADNVKIAISTGNHVQLYTTPNDTTVTNISVSVHKILTDDPVPIFEIVTYNDKVVVGDSPLQLVQNKLMYGFVISNLGADTYLDDLYISNQKGMPMIKCDYQALITKIEEICKFTRTAGYIYEVFEEVIELRGKSSMMLENIHSSDLTPDILLLLVPGKVDVTPVGPPRNIISPTGPGEAARPIEGRTRFYVGGKFNAGAGVGVAGEGAAGAFR